MDDDARDLGLVLLSDADGIDRAAARRTRRWERRFVSLIDSRRSGPAMVSAVIVAGLAAGPFGIRFGRPFGKRRGLAFAAASEAFELGQPRLQLGDFAIACRTAGTSRFGGEVVRAGFHADGRLSRNVKKSARAVNRYPRQCLRFPLCPVLDP